MNFNYSSQAIDDLLELADRYKAPMFNKFSATIVGICEGLQNSVKFALPDGGRLFPVENLSRSDFNILRLPYPIIALEYFCSGADFHSNEHTNPAPKRICLAAETHLSESAGRDGIFVWSLWRDETIGKWGTAKTCAYIPRDQDYPENKLLHIETPLAKQETDLSFEILPLFEGLCRLDKIRFGRKRALHRAALDLLDEVNALISFIFALGCSNVVIRDSDNSRRINKKRLKNKKRPLFSYKEILIEAPNTKGSVIPNVEMKKKRRSPRQHLRRGHVRRLSSSKRIWINHMVVGSKRNGTVFKSYNVVQGKIPQTGRGATV